MSLLAVSAGCGGVAPDAQETRALPETVEGKTTATTTTTGNTGETQTTEQPAASGDAAAGKMIFADQGCGACHTYKPAGSSGQTGPDLDNLAADAQKANHGSIEEYTRESIEDPDAYVVTGFPKGVMPPFKGKLTESQISELVDFLTKKS